MKELHVLIARDGSRVVVHLNGRVVKEEEGVDRVVVAYGTLQQPLALLDYRIPRGL